MDALAAPGAQPNAIRRYSRLQICATPERAAGKKFAQENKIFTDSNTDSNTRNTKELDAVSKALKSAGWTIIAAEMRYLAKSFPELDEGARKQVAAFLTSLDDHDDVHHVYAALK